MKKMMRISGLLFCLVAIYPAAWSATYNVPGDYATLSAAIADAAVVTGDVLNMTAGTNETANVQFTKGVTVNGNGNTITLTGTLIQIQTTEAVTIDNVVVNAAGGTGIAVQVENTGLTTISNSTIDGASFLTCYQNTSGSRLELVNTTLSGAAFGVQIDGNDTFTTLTQSTIDLGAYNGFAIPLYVNSGQGSTITVDQSNITGGGNTAAGNNNQAFGYQTIGSNATLNVINGSVFDLDTNFAGIIVNTGPGTVINVSDSTLVAPAGGNCNIAWSWGGDGILTFTNCTLGTGGASPFLQAPVSGNVTITNPTFASSGAIAFNVGNMAGQNTNLTLQGTDAANKLDLDGLVSAGSNLHFRGHGGVINLNNVTGATAPGLALLDTDFSSSPTAATTVNVSQSEFIDGAGTINVAFSRTDGSEVAGVDQPVTINATNTIWRGPSSATPLNANFDSGVRTSAVDFNLTHCTWSGASGSGLFIDGLGGDTVVADYNIFNNAVQNELTGATQNGTAVSSLAMTGSANLIYDPTPLDGTGGFIGGQTGTVLTFAPVLDATGRTTGESDTAGKAIGSTTIVDIDGLSRPNPTGTTPDLGANETLSDVPVELSNFEIQ